MFSNTTYSILGLILMYFVIHIVKDNIINIMYNLYYIVFTDYDKYILSRINYIILCLVLISGIYKSYVLKWKKKYINNNINDSTYLLSELSERIN
jgi:hypothetical protein